jgi:hypothetical protein
MIVHHIPVDGVGAQLFPGSLATSTPQTFPMASWPAPSTGVRVALPRCWSDVRCCPAPIRQISSRFLSCGGSTTGSCNTCTFPSCLPGPGRLAVPTRLVVVGAAPTLPCASRVGLPPASPGCCDSPEVGLPSHPVKWRLVAHEFVEKLLTANLTSTDTTERNASMALPHPGWRCVGARCRLAVRCSSASLVAVTVAGRCRCRIAFWQSSARHSGGSAGVSERQEARHSAASHPSMM